MEPEVCPPVATISYNFMAKNGTSLEVIYLSGELRASNSSHPFYVKLDARKKKDVIQSRM